MAEASSDFDLAAAHRYFAVDCFNATWELIDKKDRTAEGKDEMLGYAYEALARSAALAGKTEDRRRFLGLARDFAEKVEEPDERKLLLDELATIP